MNLKKKCLGIFWNYFGIIIHIQHFLICWSIKSFLFFSSQIKIQIQNPINFILVLFLSREQRFHHLSLSFLSLCLFHILSFPSLPHILPFYLYSFNHFLSPSSLFLSLLYLLIISFSVEYLESDREIVWRKFSLSLSLALSSLF